MVGIVRGWGKYSVTRGNNPSKTFRSSYLITPFNFSKRVFTNLKIKFPHISHIKTYVRITLNLYLDHCDCFKVFVCVQIHTHRKKNYICTSANFLKLFYRFLSVLHLKYLCYGDLKKQVI